MKLVFLFKILIAFLCSLELSISQNGGLPYPFQNFISLKKQRLEHFQKGPMFQLRKYNFDFITDIPKDSVTYASLFFRTDSMETFREISLSNSNGLFRFKYDPNQFPAKKIEYFFVLQTEPANIYAFPLTSDGKLTTSKHIFIDPIQYYRQNSIIKR